MQLSEELLAHYPIVSDQVDAGDIRLILDELSATLARQVPGDIVEFGCYIGTTSLFIRRVLDRSPGTADRMLHVYDSFAGLPPKTIADASIAGTAFKAGELAVSKKQLRREFQRAGLHAPVVHKGWFDELTARDVPPTIAFAFLDGDFYESILSSLQLVWPRLAGGGTIVVDDYAREALPGVERAVRDFFHGRLPELRQTHGLAIMHKE